MTLAVGSQAPEFTAQMANGLDVRLSDLLGKYVLLFFYPRDFTPGCTAESCSLNDNLTAFEGLGATVVGVSSQGRTSHARFQSTYGLGYPLVADTDRAVGDAYGVPARGVTGKSSARVSFLIDPSGKIVRVWDKVSPVKHAAEVMEAIQSRLAA